MKRVRWAAAVALLAFAPPLSGCGLVTLMHDQMIGPISPAGPIHDAAVGTGFEASFEGVSGNAEGEALLRPLPRDMIRRMGSPSSFHSLLIGIEAFLFGASSWADRRSQTGAAPDAGRIPALGASLDEVVTALGPPDQWVRFAGGETLAYRAERERWTTLNIGIPPVLGFLIPIPGVSALAYRRIDKKETSTGFVLFFDGERRLARVATPAQVQLDRRVPRAQTRTQARVHP